MKEIQITKKLLFINVGVETKKQHEEHSLKIKQHTLRKWKNSLDYGFISGGQGTKWKKQIEKVEVDDIICAYITEHGFVGIGKCISAPVPIRHFKTCQKKFLKDVKLISPTYILEHNNDNLDLCDYAFGVFWFEGLTVDQKDAKSVSGLNLGITQHIRTNLFNNQKKMMFIEKAFDVKFIFP
jgi:hypothetical protein